jgi:predicted TIM-barrel enzyme
MSILPLFLLDGIIGMGYDKEVEAICIAHELDMLTTPYVFNPDEAVAMAEAGRKVRDDIMVICHGGPFDEPENVAKGLAMMPGIVGFFSASSIERLPTERVITGQVEAFKKLELA